MKDKKTGVTLLELVIAVLILSAAIIPLAAMIGKDAGNTVVLSHSQFAMSIARQTMDTILDTVDFDELTNGSPATLTGEAKTKLSEILFPGGSGSCNGNVEHKGWLFNVKLDAVEIPNSYLANSLVAYKNPDIKIFLPPNNSSIDTATNQENSNTPSYNQSDDPASSPYRCDSWASADDNFDIAKFEANQGTGITHLMKALSLTITWNDRKPSEPVPSAPPADGTVDKDQKSFTIIAHKARLKKNG